MYPRFLLRWALLAAVCLPALLHAAPAHLVLVGDSTVTDDAGWGLGFRQFLTDGVTLTNTARGGRSSMSFIKEGLWEKALALKGDYYLIQFGHNDEPGKPGRSTTMEEYRAYMNRYVDETRAAGAIPVLVTSLVRRQFKADPHRIESSLNIRAEVVREIAREKRVPLIELHDRSKELCEKLGREGCLAFSPKKENGSHDGTHLNIEGRVLFGRIVAEELRAAVPALAPFLRSEPRDPRPQANPAAENNATVAFDSAGRPLTVPAAGPVLAPAPGAREVTLNPVLGWPAVADATDYDVFFGESESPAFQCRVTQPRFVLETLRAGTTYHWRVDAVTPAGVRPGRTLSFTVTTRPDRDDVYAWPTRIARSARALWPDPVSFGGFNYTQGMVAEGLCLIAERTGRTDDAVFAQAWLDRFVAADGTIDPKGYPPKYYSLDRVRPGQALLLTYERTKDERYLRAAHTLARQLDEQPRTSEGGYWHRSTYPNQMWLDGIYMADVFAVRYAALTGQPKYFDEAVRQITLIHRHTRDPKTGLYFHGWDESKTRPWANQETGASPEIWGRAVGWYAMAMVDVLDTLPADHPGRAQVLPIFRALCAGLLQSQDRDTAMWYQIMDKPAGPKNYVESSCSLMFAYALLRGVQHGWLPPEYSEHARRAVRGVLNHKIDLKPDGTMDIRDTVVVGTLGGAGGFYDAYLKDRIVTNDQKAIGTFMFLSLALAESATEPAPAKP